MGDYSKAPHFVKDMVDDTIKREGGYVNNKHDRGGETKYGITLSTARSWGYTGMMKDLPLETAREILTSQYYCKPKINLLHDLSPIIAEEIFDAGVLSGTQRAVLWLQETLNVLNLQGKLYIDITEDGVLGNETKQALSMFLTARGSEGERVLYNLLNCKQGAFFLNLPRRRVADEEFVYGWARNRLTFL